MDAIPSRVTQAARGVEANGAWYDRTAGTKINVVSRWRTKEFHGSFCDRNTLIGLERVSLDFSLLKNFLLSLGKRFQFPAEFLNPPNRASFGLPTGSLFDSRGPPSELLQDQIHGSDNSPDSSRCAGGGADRVE